jgi:hypothetical protein
MSINIFYSLIQIRKSIYADAIFHLLDPEETLISQLTPEMVP